MDSFGFPHCFLWLFTVYVCTVQKSMNRIWYRFKRVSWYMCVSVSVCVCVSAVPWTHWCKRPVCFLRVFGTAGLVKIIFSDVFPTSCNVTLFISGKLRYMFRVVSPPIIRSTHTCIYSIWYLSMCYCYLPLAAGSSSNTLTSARCCKYSCVFLMMGGGTTRNM